MFKKKHTVLVLTLVLVFSLSLTANAIFGLGDDDKKENKEVTLTFWHGFEQENKVKVFKEKIAMFEEEHPNINIKPQSYGAADNAVGKIMTAVAGGNPPEMMWYGPQMTGRLARADALAPAEEFIKNDSGFNSDDIFSGLWDVGTYKGTRYTIPFDANNLGIFYNKDYFKQAGIEELPETWAELVEVAEKVQKNSPAEYGFQVPMGTKEWTVWTWETFLWQAGGELINEDFTKPLFNSEAGAEALQFWTDLRHEEGVANFSQTGAGYKTGDLVSGQIAMQIIGPWVVPSLNETDLNYGTFMMPKKESRATNIGGENLYIFKTNEAKEKAAWEFAKFIMSADFQVDWAMETGYLPVSKSAQNNDRYQKFLQNNQKIKTFADQMKYGFARPCIPEYSSDLSPALGKAIEKALYQKSAPQAALDEAAKKVEEALK